MEGFALRFSTSGSQLVKSFWAGKIIQQLHLTEEDLERGLATPTGFSAGTAATPFSLPTSDSTTPASQPPLEEVFKCLARCETSLSPRVHAMICSCTKEATSHALPVGGAPMHSDGTLDWTKVAQYFSK